MPEKDDDLQTLSEVIASLEDLPELHIGRIWLNAIKAIQAKELNVEPIEGPGEYGSLVWSSMIVVGALSDGKPRFHMYPPGTAADDLAARDAATEGIRALKGTRGDATKLLELAERNPSTTFAVFARAHADEADGPLIVQLLYHPKASYRDAVGWLKLTADFIRKQEATAGGKT